MANIATWKAVVAHYKSMPSEVQKYFAHFPKLVEDYPWEVSIAYVFSRVELAHNMAIYCGAVKLHRANGELARTAIQSHHMTRQGFTDLFRTIHEKEIPKSTTTLLAKAENIRDRALHGKSTTEKEHREALCEVLDYAVALNAFVRAHSGFKPFNDLRGFKGRGKALDKSTTRWLLKGMGFSL